MGDRLNFGLAAERARALGVKIEIVIVKDDISLPAISQARGIAGVLFVEKSLATLRRREQACERLLKWRKKLPMNWSRLVLH